MADLEQPVIVKKVKVQEEGAHGGAWKVAYADFVTAMMAFFLLLWLLNATEQETLDGLSNYFTPTVQTSSSPSGSGNMFGGQSPNDPGPTQDAETQSPDASEGSATGNINTDDNSEGRENEVTTGSDGQVNADDEAKRFNQAKDNLETQINELPPELADLKQTFKIDITDEGLRIQLVDTREKANFELGTHQLTNHAQMALQLLSDIAVTLPNPIAITGHTAGAEGVDAHWNLSINRANSVRRGLSDLGIGEARIEVVGGLGDSSHLIPENPESPQNRRMSIVLLRQAPAPP